MMRLYIKRAVLLVLGAAGTLVLLTLFNEVDTQQQRSSSDNINNNNNRNDIVAELFPAADQRHEMDQFLQEQRQRRLRKPPIQRPAQDHFQNLDFPTPASKLLHKFGDDGNDKATPPPPPDETPSDDREEKLSPFMTRNLQPKKKGSMIQIRSPDKGKKWWPQIPFNKKSDSDYEDLPTAANRRPKPELLALRTHLTKWAGLDHLACEVNKTIGKLWKEQNSKHVFPQTDAWETFFHEIGSCDMYREEDYDRIVQRLLDDMRSLPVKHVGIMDGGTQVKLVIDFENGKQAAFKPMRFSRQYETDPNHFYFSDFERHNAEIAAFHLDRVLGLRHALPTTSRVFNLSSEIEVNAEKSLAKTFFISPFKNLCFVGHCDYYCDTTHAICGKPHMKEGSLQVFLPDEEDVPREHNRSPYRRTYSKRRQIADWQQDPNYCTNIVKRKKAFAHGRRLVDLAEMSVFDFLTGNQDRHHFETFAVFENFPAYPIFFDNGRALVRFPYVYRVVSSRRHLTCFGRPFWDDHDILAPLSQCCVIRPKFLRRLLELYGGEKTLSEALHESMSRDQAAPILANKHFPALERRLEYVLDAVKKCIDVNGPDDVVRNSYDNPEIDPDAPEEEDDEEDARKHHHRKKHHRNKHEDKDEDNDNNKEDPNPPARERHKRRRNGA